jgi:hypothetical protein
MSVIFLMEPLYVVEVGPMSGVYFSRKAYETILKLNGKDHIVGLPTAFTSSAGKTSEEAK